MAKNKAPTSEVLDLGTAADPVRLSFARLWTPKAFRPGQEPRYEATFLMDPTRPAHAKLIAKLKGVAKDLAEKACGNVPPDLKLCMFKGDTKPYDGYKGMVAIATHNKIKPRVVSRGGITVEEGGAGAPFSGCYVIGKITLWGQNNEYGKRVNANLLGVQFVKDGPAFGMQPMDEDDFEALEDDDSSPVAGDDSDDIPF